VRAAVEPNAVNTNAATGLWSATRIDDSNILGSTALGVLDRGTALGTERCLLAGGSIMHGVVKVEVAIKLRSYLERVDGELLRLRAKARAAREIG
jgi:hypothetical protein